MNYFPNENDALENFLDKITNGKSGLVSNLSGLLGSLIDTSSSSLSFLGTVSINGRTINVFEKGGENGADVALQAIVFIVVALILITILCLKITINYTIFWFSFLRLLWIKLSYFYRKQTNK